MTTDPDRRKWVHLHAGDNVAVSLTEFEKGSVVDLGSSRITLLGDVPFGHKFAIRDISAGEPVIKYDETIGVASQPISAGDHVHVHNLQSLRASRP